MPMRLAIAVLLLLPASVAVGRDAPELLWRFAPGERLEIVREVKSTTVTTTSLGDEKPVAARDEGVANTTLDATVAVMDGGYRLDLKIREFSFRRGEGAEVLSVAAFRDPRGDPRVRIRTGAELRLTEEARTLIEKVAARLLRCSWELSITPLGEVHSTTFTGSPFPDLGVGGVHSRIVEGMLRSLNTESDLAGLLGKSMFTRLPGGESKPGRSWTTERELELSDIELSGRGTANLLPAAEGATVRIEEKVGFTVNTEALRARTLRLIGAMFKQMGQPARTEVEVAGVPVVPARIVTTIRDGVPTTEWDEISVAVTGRVRVDIGGDVSSAKVESKTKATIRTVIRRL